MSFGGRLSGSLKFYRSAPRGLIGYCFLAERAATYVIGTTGKCEKNHIFWDSFCVFALIEHAPEIDGKMRGESNMKSSFARFAESIDRTRIASVLGVFLSVVSASSAFALGTPEQRRACTPDVYRLCAGEIPNVRAIIACLQRQKGNLSSACRSAMEQNGE